MKDYIDTWGYYPWLTTSNSMDLIHPDDRDIVSSTWTSEMLIRLVNCIGIENEYLILKLGTQVVRAKPDIYDLCPPPMYSYGDMVREVLGKQRIGHIRDILWHRKREEEYYLLSINGKKSTKWQFREDLELIKQDLNGNHTS